MKKRPASKPKKFIPASELVVQHSQVGTGTHQFTCWWSGHFGPVGVVWVVIFKTKAGMTAQVVESFVPKWARRQGIRTRINQEIFTQADTIVTSDASNKDGMAFMRAAGYVRDHLTGQMVLCRADQKGRK